MRGKQTYTQDEMELALALAKRVRKLRESKGLTQEKLAQLAEITTPTYQALERGKGKDRDGKEVPLNPKTFTLFRVCKALGITLSELLDGLDE